MLPDQVAREGSHLWEDGVTPNTSAIFRENVSNCEDMLYQMAMVDRDEFAVGKLPTAEESIHEELIIHSLGVQVWGDSMCREQSEYARNDQRNFTQQSVRRKPYWE